MIIFNATNTSMFVALIFFEFCMTKSTSTKHSFLRKKRKYLKGFKVVVFHFSA